MSREIKFRAWNGQVMREYVRIEPSKDMSWVIQPFPNVSGVRAVMQFIGRLDKNGKDIYEGDVVKQFNGLTAECKWDSQFAGFVYDKEGMVDVESSHNSVEVIGNVFENPELLEN
jgi:hypothetical protein